MALRHLIRRRAVVTAAASVMAGATLLPPRLVHAEASDDEARNRRPIYDDEPLIPTSAIIHAPTTTPPPQQQTPSAATSPTPTDRLAVHIRKLRLALHSSAAKAEDAANNALTESLRLEHSFTSTIAGLAPPKETHERILPNGIYVLIAAMGTQILTRNRSLPIRFTLPLLVGVGAANAVLPHTMNNVNDLIWTYEKKYPVIAENHIRIKERVIQFWETGKAHSAMTVNMLEDKVGGARESVEGWVKKGR